MNAKVVARAVEIWKFMLRRGSCNISIIKWSETAWFVLRRRRVDEWTYLEMEEPRVTSFTLQLLALSVCMRPSSALEFEDVITISNKARL